MNAQFIMAVVLSSVVTITLRAMPIVLLSKLQLPTIIHTWLKFIPASIMAAIVTMEVLAKPALSESGWSISALATLVCLATGILTRSLFLTVLVGIVAYMTFQWLIL